MRPRIIAGNWKMNKTFEEAEELTGLLVDYIKQHDLANKEVIIFPPYVYLELAGDLSEGSELKFGAQNVSQYEKGAFTGEISALMLASMETEYVIIGHSERRSIFGETNSMLAEKVKIALKYDIKPVFCIGETLEEREAKNHFDIVKDQLCQGLFHLTREEISRCMIAYEPVWAIGTGVSARPEQAEEMHAYIRKLIKEKYGTDVAENILILYGGSVKPGNAGEIFHQPNVDGGLIGGASLIFEDFKTIIEVP